MKRIIWLLVATVALSGCTVPLTHYNQYRGDGTFTPHAAPSALCQDGYTLDLGTVDLGAPSEVTHALSGLPPIEAVIGLAVERKAVAIGEMRGDVFSKRPAPLIEITLRDASGRVVLSRHELLTQWIGSRIAGDHDHAFLFQRGTEAEIATAPGAVRVERFPIGIDDSWGTYFKPRRDARYALHFALEEPAVEGDAVEGEAAAADVLRDVDVRLQVRGVVGCL